MLTAEGVRAAQGYRDVFLLREIQGHTLAEITAILEISPRTAVVRLKRARRAIGYFDTSVATDHAQ
jgi:DNA-directed RNA polymerase specialized sigma24 family protein